MKKIKTWCVPYVTINFRTMRGQKIGLDAARISDDAMSCAHLYRKLENLYVIPAQIVRFVLFHVSYQHILSAQKGE